MNFFLKVEILVSQTLEKVKFDADAFENDLKVKEILKAKATEEVDQQALEVVQLQKSLVELQSKLRIQQVCAFTDHCFFFSSLFALPRIFSKLSVLTETLITNS